MVVAETGAPVVETDVVAVAVVAVETDFEAELFLFPCQVPLEWIQQAPLDPRRETG